MENTEVVENLKEIISLVIKHEDFEMNPELRATDIPGWDSLSHITIITKIENAFNIKFSLKEIMKLKNLGSLIELVKVKIQGKQNSI